MFKSKYWFILLILVPIILTNCAKRGSITGGPKDTLAPVLTSSFPKNYSKKFEGKTITLTFDEYVKVKDANKQVIVSPPLKKQLSITPQGGASKTLTLRFTDTLQDNTTYSINFGESIIDNNEGNPYSAFKYVFSTGDVIDSLKLSGTTSDALSQTNDDYVSVMLYPAETFSDSTIYKETPLYITNTLEKNSDFTLDFVKEGTYYLIALKDKGRVNLFDPAVDKIGFLDEPITFPVDSTTTFNLKMFQEIEPFALKRPAQQSNNKVSFGIGKTKFEDFTIDAELNNNKIETRFTRVTEKDSILLWLPELEIQKEDSLKIKLSNLGETYEQALKLKTMKQTDTLVVNIPKSSALNFRDNFTITASTPIETFDATKVTLLKKDSTAVPFEVVLNKLNNKVELLFEKHENEVLTATFLPETLVDFYGKANDTIVAKINIPVYTDFANLNITVENIKEFPIILQLLDSKEKVIYEAYSEKETEFIFNAIEPNKYTVRIIYDTDKNGEWTTGNYLLKQQPEEVYYYPQVIDARANWEINQTITIPQ
ncbi:Ig-like domain-containing protein [Flavobacterium agricola]|uniref:Ig-like domain-containing protein n=1 Tax=Flavobacterium agricola TaxID=2870839 RepID=A0ABY6M067_9FLAO|nr:Ig-like domain-containing protein [Flavobacterium agricola]UYW00805.1 Ig-like domain-containing protein [Flavobacterium agricola]